MKPQRRVVAIDREAGKSALVGDTPSPDVRTDPARPGFAIHRLWVVDGFPAKIVYETLQRPNVLVPPPKGSVLNVFSFPPDHDSPTARARRETRANPRRSEGAGKSESGLGNDSLRSSPLFRLRGLRGGWVSLRTKRLGAETGSGSPSAGNHRVAG
jgi:hypothetical protein